MKSRSNSLRNSKIYHLSHVLFIGHTHILYEHIKESNISIHLNLSFWSNLSKMCATRRCIQQKGRTRRILRKCHGWDTISFVPPHAQHAILFTHTNIIFLLTSFAFSLFDVTFSISIYFVLCEKIELYLWIICIV
jgi:hypothetical protein